MFNIDIIILSIAMAIDATLVSFYYGVRLEKRKLYYSFVLAFMFALFQFSMPFLGYLLGEIFYSKLIVYSKYIVFGIFLLLGLKFLKESFSDVENLKCNNPSFLCILILSILTSIDAMGAGVSIKFIKYYIVSVSILIGLITFILSFISFWLSTILKRINSKVVNRVGAGLLIYLAIKAIIF